MDFLPNAFAKFQKYWDSPSDVAVQPPVQPSNTTSGTVVGENDEVLDPNDVEFVPTPNTDQQFEKLKIDYKGIHDRNNISLGIEDMVNLVFAESPIKSLSTDEINDIQNEGNDSDLRKLDSLSPTIRKKGFNFGNHSLRSGTMSLSRSLKSPDTLILMQDDGITQKPTDCWNKLVFWFESFLVKHVRFYALYLSGYQLGVRGLYLFDMYTDIIIALELYYGNEKIWFLLSCIFITLPFALVWSASLRFIQNYIMNYISSATNIGKMYVLNIILIIYMFPPAGSLFIALSEIYWTASDIWYTLKAFIFGNALLIKAADRQTNAMKTYRKAIEIFAESIPQTLLQTYIYLNLKYVTKDKVLVNEYGIDEKDLIISIFVSLINLMLNFIEFRFNANLHGMLFSEYALSILQLAEVPMPIFVPRLSAIKKGYVTNVNFCGFQFDKASVTPLLEALHSDNCQLQTIKISIGSLSNLDLSSCKMLGHLLRNNSNQTGINVIISRITSLLNVQKLFEKFDTNKNGYLEFDDWIEALKSLKSPIMHQCEQKQRRIFEQLAIRRGKKDRIYFYDFFNKTTDTKTNSYLGFDVTEIQYPLHFIFIEIKELIENKNDSKNEKQLLINLGKLFHFCIGLNCLNQIEHILSEHVFYKLIDAQYSIDKLPENQSIKVNQYDTLLWAFFLHLLKINNSFKTQFFLSRNDIFRIDIHCETVKLLKAKEFILKLDKECGYSGYNIFEFCFLYKDENRNKCKSFVYLFSALLYCLKQQYCENKTEYFNKNYEIIWNEKGELNMLFKETNGFYIKDITQNTPLYYAVKEGKHNVVEFFAQYIMMTKNKNNENKTATPGNNNITVNWIYDQNYLHSILHALFLTNSPKPAADLFRLLLDTEKIDINYYCQPYGGHLSYGLIRYRSNTSNAKKRMYLLKCLEILNDYNYDFVNNIDLPSKNNVLHYAILLNDYEAISKLINCCTNIKQLLKMKNKNSQLPFHVAMELCKTDIVELLIEFDETQIDFELFLRPENKNSDAKWITCLAELIARSRGKILHKFSQAMQEALLWYVKEVIQVVSDFQSDDNEHYMDLKSILLHLHKSLGVPMTINTLK